VGRRGRLRQLRSARGVEFLAGLRPAGDRRWRDVRALWPVLRLDFRPAAAHVAGWAIALINSCVALGSYGVVGSTRAPATRTRPILLMAASLLITVAVGAEEVRAVGAEEVRAVAAGLSPHP
jgi:hypothetical protein